MRQFKDLRFEPNPEYRDQFETGVAWDNGFEMWMCYRERRISNSHKYCVIITPPEEMNRGVLTKLNITAEQAGELMERTEQNRWEESDFPEHDPEQNET